VAASETYNTALENHLRAGLGVRFAERPNPDPRLRPVREIVGVDPGLNARWSTRRASIEIRRGELAADFQRVHGRPPTPVESLKLAQQATLETRDAKHVPRTLTEQRQAWLIQAGEVLGGPQAVQHMVHTALHPDPVSIMFTIPWPRREGSSLCYRALAVLAFGRRRHRRLLPPFGLDCDVERAWSGARHRRNGRGAIRHLASRSAAGVCTRLSRRVLTGQTWSTMVRTNCS
jgi:hypothetical protein